MDAVIHELSRSIGQVSAPDVGSGDLVCETGNDLNFALGWFMFVMQIPLVYVPQYWKLVAAKSHIGLSLSNCIAFCVVSYLFLINYVCAQYEATFGCCSAGHGTRACLYGLAPFLQTVTAWIGCVATLGFYYAVFDRPGLEAAGFDPDAEVRSAKLQCSIGVALHLVLALVAVVIAAISGSITSDAVKQYGYAANIACAVLLATHWFLQMYETRKTQCVGSLSILSCVLSSLGCFATAGSFYQHGGLGVSMAYFVGGVVIAVAVAYAISVERRNQRIAASAISKDVTSKLADSLRDPECENEA